MAHAPEKLMSADELLALGDIGRCELIDGELIRMSPAGFEHGWIAARMLRMVAEHVEDHELGIVLAAETGFLIRRDPDTVRAPDVSFISNEHLPDPLPRRGFFPGSPDFAVEVVSPEDSWSEVVDKAQDWLSSGAQLVWVVDPKTRSVTAYSPSGVLMVSENGIADADPVVRGFSISVAEIFRR